MINVLEEKAHPAKSRQVALYVTYLHRQGLRTNTIRTHLSAIAYFHKIRHNIDPTSTFTIKRLLAGYTKQDTPAKSRKPITKPLLQNILSSIAKKVGCAYTKALFLAMITLMYHAALRVSEVCHTPRAQHTLQLKHIHTKANSMKLQFDTYKHNTQPTTKLTITATKDTYCPVHLMKKYLAKRGSLPGLLFCTKQGKPTYRTQLTNTIKEHLTLIGHNADHYNTHSLRAGKATDMAAAGHSTTHISLAGRWRSNAYLKYIKPHTIHI